MDAARLVVRGRAPHTVVDSDGRRDVAAGDAGLAAGLWRVNVFHVLRNLLGAAAAHPPGRPFAVVPARCRQWDSVRRRTTDHVGSTAPSKLRRWRIRMR